MSDSGSLALLTTCADATEAGALKARLEAEGIPSVIQGGQHQAMLGMFGGAIIEVRVLVPGAALERAQTLLSAWQSDEGESVPGHLKVVESADEKAPRCAEHGAPSVGTCSRCGAFVCDACAAGTDEAPLCLKCEDRAVAEQPNRRERRRWRGYFIIAIFAAPLIGMAMAQFFRDLVALLSRR